MSELLKGKIVEVEESEDLRIYEIEIIGGEKSGDKIQIEYVSGQIKGMAEYKEGEQIYIESTVIEGTEMYAISGYVRVMPLFLLFLVFAVLVVATCRKRGIGALLGLFVSGIVLFVFAVPALAAGHNAVLIGLFSLITILIPTMYFSHGFNPKSTTALVGTVISLTIAGLLGVVFMYLTKLTGLGNEDARNLAIQSNIELNFGAILLFSLILGTLGVIDDVTVGQVSIVREVFKANPEIGIQKLFRSAMAVGVDHIASMVNTLIMAYVGSALPMVMLFYSVDMSMGAVVSVEFVAEEIVRMLVGSIGLVLAVPVTTLISCYIITRPGNRERWLGFE